MPVANPIFCAIDRPDVAGACELARALVDAVGGVKLGLEFFVANGPAGCREVAAAGLPLFLDLKLHDIPATVAGAVRAACRLRPTFLTLHAGGGPAMLRAAIDAAAESPASPRLLGVTVLTSLDDADLAATGVADDAAAQALRLAELCARAGLAGLVCSPFEIGALRARFGRDLMLVVPGIRGPDDDANDQKRTLSAAGAMTMGADILVIGRPITRAAAPREAAAALLRGLPKAA